LYIEQYKDIDHSVVGPTFPQFQPNFQDLL